jgi:hypothetical protein
MFLVMKFLLISLFFISSQFSQYDDGFLGWTKVENKATFHIKAVD